MKGTASGGAVCSVFRHPCKNVGNKRGRGFKHNANSAWEERIPSSSSPELGHGNGTHKLTGKALLMHHRDGTFYNKPELITIQAFSPGRTTSLHYCAVDVTSLHETVH
ncbi:hypothetical protein J6590_000366 [Homalodisca vitripennis]|nr:hypothetical protein J6590_000366 [Homalodisca vitripennis]